MSEIRGLDTYDPTTAMVPFARYARGWTPAPIPPVISRALL